MKKIIFLLLFTVAGFSQTVPTGTTKAGKFEAYSPEVGANSDQVSVWNATDKKMKVVPKATYLAGFGNPFNTNQTNAITSANSPSDANYFATILDLSLKQNSMFGIGRVVQNGSITSYDNSSIVNTVNGQSGDVILPTLKSLIGTTTGNNTTQPLIIKGLVIDSNISQGSQNIGFGIITSGSGNTCSGYLSKINGDNATVYGNSSQSLTAGTAIGWGSKSGNGSCSYGNDSKALGDAASAFSVGSNATGIGSTAFGVYAQSSGFDAIGLGHYAKSNFDYSIVFGSYATSTANNQLVFSATNGTKNIRFNNNILNNLDLDFPLTSGRLALESQISSQSPTNITYIPSLRQINSSTGTGAVLPIASSTDAGLILNTDKIKIDNTSGINSGDNSPNSLYSSLVSNATHTGDVTGSTNLILATVNPNVGSFTNPSITVNAKGLVTSIQNGILNNPVDASSTTKGILQLTNDLGGTADLPTTPTAVHLSGNEEIIGQKTFNNSTIQPSILVNTYNSGDGIVSKSTTLNGLNTGFLFVGKNNSNNTFTVDKFGTVIANGVNFNTEIANKINSNLPIIAGTNTKITYDLKGLVTSGSSLIASDIPSIAKSQVINLTAELDNKQNLLISGTNIKSLNGLPILGSGDLIIQNLTKFNQNVSSGISIALTNYNTQTIYINPSSLLTSYIVTLPTNPSDGDIVFIAFGGAIAPNNSVVSNLSIVPSAGKLIYQSITPITANGGDWFKYVYNQANLTFYRQNL